MDVRRAYNQASPLARKALDRLAEVREKTEVITKHLPEKLTEDETKLLGAYVVEARTALNELKKALGPLTKKG